MILEKFNARHHSSKHGRYKDHLKVNLVDVLLATSALSQSQLVDGRVDQVSATAHFTELLTVEAMVFYHWDDFHVELSCCMSYEAHS